MLPDEDPERDTLEDDEDLTTPAAEEDDMLLLTAPGWRCTDAAEAERTDELVVRGAVEMRAAEAVLAAVLSAAEGDAAPVRTTLATPLRG